jgi:hypothetical protein
MGLVNCEIAGIAKNCRNCKPDLGTKNWWLTRSRSGADFSPARCARGIRNDTMLGVNRASLLDVGMNGINRGGVEAC